MKIHRMGLGDEPIGLLSAYEFSDAVGGGHLVYLYDIEVDLKHRRHGAGRALVEALLEACETRNVRTMWPGTGRDNVAARRTFESAQAELEGDAYVEYEWDLEI
jgi:ribosomal protein S18 acetylase RimI-like enzyme